MNDIHKDAMDAILSSCGFSLLDEFASPSDTQLLMALYGSIYELTEPELLPQCAYIEMCSAIIRMRISEDVCAVSQKQIIIFNKLIETNECNVDPLNMKTSFICYGLVMGGNKC